MPPKINTKYSSRTVETNSKPHFLSPIFPKKTLTSPLGPTTTCFHDDIGESSFQLRFLPTASTTRSRAQRCTYQRHAKGLAIKSPLFVVRLIWAKLVFFKVSALPHPPQGGCESRGACARLRVISSPSPKTSNIGSLPKTLSLSLSLFL